jgi:hypothetical protein
MKLEFNEQQMAVLNAALMELPFRVAAPVIQHINNQIAEQRALEFDARREAAKDKSQV